MNKKVITLIGLVGVGALVWYIYKSKKDIAAVEKMKQDELDESAATNQQKSAAISVNIKSAPVESTVPSLNTKVFYSPSISEAQNAVI